MLPFRSIKSLYWLALAEGEGVGTAYEYFAKRLVLRPWLAQQRRSRTARLLIGGLPEKYGSSLDFFLIAQELGVAEVLVIDDRPAALEKARHNLAAAHSCGELTNVRPHYEHVSDIASLPQIRERFDLCLASEVLQRIPAGARREYVTRISGQAASAALFAPNGDNPSHTSISGLAGLGLAELRDLMQAVGLRAGVGYVDMPPFPPGITRSAEQRRHASSGRLEGLVMRGLACHARLERSFPRRWRQHHSHIVYAFTASASS